jgi:hypothetical protein
MWVSARLYYAQTAHAKAIPIALANVRFIGQLVPTGAHQQRHQGQPLICRHSYRFTGDDLPRLLQYDMPDVTIFMDCPPVFIGVALFQIHGFLADGTTREPRDFVGHGGL